MEIKQVKKISLNKQSKYFQTLYVSTVIYKQQEKKSGSKKQNKRIKRTFLCLHDKIRRSSSSCTNKCGTYCRRCLKEKFSVDGTQENANANLGFIISDTFFSHLTAVCFFLQAGQHFSEKDLVGEKVFTFSTLEHNGW